jgi:hypothetical protein
LYLPLKHFMHNSRSHQDRPVLPFPNKAVTPALIVTMMGQRGEFDAAIPARHT